MSDTYTPEPHAWHFTPEGPRALHQQSALEFAVHALAETDHAAHHRLIAAIREEATEARYHDPQVGIVGQPDYADALEALGNLLADECRGESRL